MSTSSQGFSCEEDAQGAQVRAIYCCQSCQLYQSSTCELKCSATIMFNLCYIQKLGGFQKGKCSQGSSTCTVKWGFFKKSNTNPLTCSMTHSGCKNEPIKHTYFPVWMSSTRDYRESMWQFLTCMTESEKNKEKAAAVLHQGQGWGCLCLYSFGDLSGAGPTWHFTSRCISSAPLIHGRPVHRVLPNRG